MRLLQQIKQNGGEVLQKSLAPYFHRYWRLSSLDYICILIFRYAIHHGMEIHHTQELNGEFYHLSTS